MRKPIMKNLCSFSRRFFSLAVVVLLTNQPLFTNQALGCTTFCLIGKGEVLFGRNYDWMIGDALIFVNKRNVAKPASLGDSSNPARWISKYGSVTFNQ